MEFRCFVALGANLGDPVATVKAAIAALGALPEARVLAVSSLYRTAPVGLKHQPDFINAVVEMIAVTSSGHLRPDGLPVSSASTFLDQLFAIEARFGRERSIPNAPRTLDLDLLLYGETISADPRCTLPHPRLHERAFVLAPLAEIAPSLLVPGHGPVSELLARCADQRIEKIVAQAA